MKWEKSTLRPKDKAWLTACLNCESISRKELKFCPYCEKSKVPIVRNYFDFPSFSQKEVKNIIKLFNMGYKPSEISRYLFSVHDYRLYNRISYLTRGNAKLENYIDIRPISISEWELANFERRIKESYVMDGYCWIWKKSVKQKGGLTLGFRNKNISVRNYIYQKHYKTTLHKNCVLEPICESQNCINPEHLRILSFKEIGDRGRKSQAKNLIKKVLDN